MFRTAPSLTATVCIPARNEQDSVASVVRGFLEVSRVGGIHEVLVVDDRSTDATARNAARAGARVISTEELCVGFGGSVGKGDAIWASLRECQTDLIGWADADLTSFSARGMCEMFRTLRHDPGIQLVKGAFERIRPDGTASAGRVTTLTARPLLTLLRPELAHLKEPLGGYFAGRTDVIGSLWIDCDYGVDIGIVLDVAARFGACAVTETHVGEIHHRSKELADLSSMSEQVARAILTRSTDRLVCPADLAARRSPPRMAAGTAATLRRVSTGH